MIESIKRKAYESAIWKLLERTSGQLVSFVVSIIIARILNPEDFVPISIVTVFFNIANIIMTCGLNTALIQKKNSDIYDYSCVLSLSLLLSIIMYVTLFILSPTLATLYKNEQLEKVIKIMGLILPIKAIEAIYVTYITSKLELKKLFFSNLYGIVVSGTISIILALNKYGVWALVIQQMLCVIINVLVLIKKVNMHFVLKIDKERLNLLFGFGWKVLVASFLGLLYSETVPLLIGIKFSTSDISYYTKGRGLPMLISASLTSSFSSILFPFLVQFNSDKGKIKEYLRLYIGVLTYLIFPIMLGLFAISDTYVYMFLTDKWANTISYIKIFSVVCMFDVLHDGNCEAIKAYGRSDIYLFIEIIKKAIYYIIIFSFMFHSESPVILASSFIFCTFAAIFVNSKASNHIFSYRYNEQLYDIVPNLIISIIMCIIVILIGKLKIEIAIKFVLQIICGISIYIILSLVSKNRNFTYILKILSERKYLSNE